jgi:hypothetical protein
VEEKRNIKWNGDMKGSLIWNKTNQILSLIQNHAFWEICGGHNALLRIDSWQKMPPLIKQHQMNNLHSKNNEEIPKHVVEIWKISDTPTLWKEWKATHANFNILVTTNLKLWNDVADIELIRLSRVVML